MKKISSNLTSAATRRDSALAHPRTGITFLPAQAAPRLGGRRDFSGQPRQGNRLGRISSQTTHLCELPIPSEQRTIKRMQNRRRLSSATVGIGRSKRETPDVPDLPKRSPGSLNLAWVTRSRFDVARFNRARPRLECFQRDLPSTSDPGTTPPVGAATERDFR